MRFLLDTNICSAHLKRPAGLVHRFVQHSGRLFIPSLVLAELYAWAYKRDDPQPVLTAIRRFLANEVNVIHFDEDCAETFGRLYGEMRRMGMLIQPVDLMIAAMAVNFDYTLVTNNTRDFRDVPELRLVDWLTP